jgi:hypothetical protein
MDCDRQSSRSAALVRVASVARVAEARVKEGILTMLTFNI